MNPKTAYSPWFRPLRQLVEEGKPVGQVTVLWGGEAKEDRIPFGLVEKRKLVCFWPIVPPNAEMSCASISTPIDHITLDVGSGCSHITYFSEDGERNHFHGGHRLVDYPESGVKYWFSMFIRWSVLDRQDRRPELHAVFPNSDATRRESEAVKYAQSMRHHPILMPPRHPDGDYLYSHIFVRTDERKPLSPTPEMLLLNRDTDDTVVGWHDGVVGIQFDSVDVGDTRLVIASTCPPGRLIEDMCFQFPTGIKHQTVQ